MEYAAALEIPVGSGGLLCAQWLVTERFETEPLAGLLLQRMLDYCARVAQVSQPAVSPTSQSAALAFPQRLVPAPPKRFGNPRYSRLGSLRYRPSHHACRGLVCEPNSPAAAKLAELGLLSENLAGRLAILDPAAHPVVIVAGMTTPGKGRCRSSRTSPAMSNAAASFCCTVPRACSSRPPKPRSSRNLSRSTRRSAWCSAVTSATPACACPTMICIGSSSPAVGTGRSCSRPTSRAAITASGSRRRPTAPFKSRTCLSRHPAAPVPEAGGSIPPATSHRTLRSHRLAPTCSR